MEEEDRKMLKDIHTFLIGDLDKQGFIGRVQKLEDNEKRLKMAIAWIGVPLGAVIAERVFEAVSHLV